MHKTCTKCEESKPEEEFYYRSTSAPEKGRRSKCKACLSARGRVYTAEERRRRSAKSREWRRRNPEKQWRTYLRTYGVTPEWYAEQIERQGGGCAVCGSIGCSTGARFSVDHDHECCPSPPLCGQCVRGLLCRSCNVGIGNLGDDAARLRAAAAYLDDYS